MEFKQLEAFVAVVDYKSFSEAAKHLYLTQPTISSHIQALEKELNSRLLIRTTKQMETDRCQCIHDPLFLPSSGAFVRVFQNTAGYPFSYLAV